MKLKTKLTIIFATPVLTMLALPLLAIKLFPHDTGMGLFFILFFLVNPLVVLGLSILAGTDIRKLWWTPLFIAVLFPFLFCGAISELVWELYVYSAFYLPIGLATMVGTHFGKKYVNKK